MFSFINIFLNKTLKLMIFSGAARNKLKENIYLNQSNEINKF